MSFTNDSVGDAVVGKDFRKPLPPQHLFLDMRCFFVYRWNGQRLPMHWLLDDM